MKLPTLSLMFAANQSYLARYSSAANIACSIQLSMQMTEKREDFTARVLGWTRADISST